MFNGELGPECDFIYSKHFNPNVLNFGGKMVALEGTKVAYYTYIYNILCFITICEAMETMLLPLGVCMEVPMHCYTYVYNILCFITISEAMETIWKPCCFL